MFLHEHWVTIGKSHEKFISLFASKDSSIWFEVSGLLKCHIFFALAFNFAKFVPKIVNIPISVSRAESFFAWIENYFPYNFCWNSLFMFENISKKLRCFKTALWCSTRFKSQYYFCVSLMFFPSFSKLDNWMDILLNIEGILNGHWGNIEGIFCWVSTTKKIKKSLG